MCVMSVSRHTDILKRVFGECVCVYVCVCVGGGVTTTLTDSKFVHDVT